MWLWRRRQGPVGFRLLVFLAVVILAPTFFTLLMGLPNASSESMSSLGSGGLFSASHILLSLGISLAFVSAMVAFYHVSMIRRIEHVASFCILLELFYRVAYGGPISPGVLLSTGETSRRESLELILGHPVLSIGLAIVALWASWELIRAWNYRLGAKTRLALLFAAVSLALVGVGLQLVATRMEGHYRLSRSMKQEFRSTFPLDLIFAAQEVGRTDWDARRATDAREAFKFGHARMAGRSEPRTAAEIYVVVIGETSRRSNWSLFGYPRDTTPGLDASSSRLIVFDHVTSNATTTIQSLPLALTRASAPNSARANQERSIVGLLRDVGFDTYWISNQARGEVLSNPIARIAAEASHVSFPDDSSGASDYDAFDSNLVERLDTALRLMPVNGKAVFFLHMEGSHYSYKNRYPPGTGRFGDDDAPPGRMAGPHAQLVNEYDNSVRFTDSLVQKVLVRLIDCDCEAGLLFFSDHGERLLDEGPDDQKFGHGFPTVSWKEIEVPFFIFLSESYRRNNGDKVRHLAVNSHATAELHSVFETIVDLTGSDYESRTPGLSLFSDKYREPRLLTVLDVSENVLQLRPHIDQATTQVSAVRAVD